MSVKVVPPIACLVVPSAAGTGEVLRAFPGTKKGQAEADKFARSLDCDWTIVYLHSEGILTGDKLVVQ